MKYKPNSKEVVQRMAYGYFMPIGSTSDCHHMSEDYYETWEKLRRREHYAKRRAEAGLQSWESWQREAKRLRDHENNYSTL